MQNLSGGTRFKCYPGPFSSVSYSTEVTHLKVTTEQFERYGLADYCVAVDDERLELKVTGNKKLKAN